MPAINSLKLTHLRQSDYQEMPWKNGGGVTTEVAIRPEGRALSGGEPFLWRLSLARLTGPGPFSAFPGYDRTLVLTEGGPLALEHGAEGRHELSPMVPYRFPGEWTTVGAMAPGDARDLNLMVRRDAVKAHVECFTAPRFKELSRVVTREAGADMLVVHVVRGRWRTTEGLELGERETLLVEGGTLAVAAATDDAACVVARISPRGISPRGPSKTGV